MAGSSRHDHDTGAELGVRVLIDKLCGGGSDITLEGRTSTLRHRPYGAWFRHVGKEVLLVARCMSGGGVSVVEFSSVNCTIKCSNSLVVQGKGRSAGEGES